MLYDQELKSFGANTHELESIASNYECIPEFMATIFTIKCEHTAWNMD